MSLVLLHDSFLLCFIFSYLGKKDKACISTTCKRWNEVVRNNTSLPFNRTFFKKMWKHCGWIVALDDVFLWVVLNSPPKEGLVDFDYEKIIRYEERRREGMLPPTSSDVFSYWTSIHPKMMIKFPLNYGQPGNDNDNNNMGNDKDRKKDDDDGYDDGCHFLFKEQRSCMMVRLRDQTIHPAPSSLSIPHWDCFPVVDSAEYNSLEDFTLDALEGAPFSFNPTYYGGFRVGLPKYDFGIYFFRFDSGDHAIQFSCQNNSLTVSTKFSFPNAPFYTISLSNIIRRPRPSSSSSS
eukprot:TRINITY_DN8907_c0_g1_i2.p1 TRINITY_DN8907_c0_g1~~TRINITY_DN8907_c0_g1_i2.p1  ORF type:complete len:300 (+),score=44.04 TRINITY_DN8907_c0_g1_i2:27-902(+)